MGVHPILPNQVVGKLVAIAPYGSAAPSVRVRVTEWLKRTYPTAPLHNYLDGDRYRLSALGQSPIRVIRAEYSLRRMQTRLHDSTLFLHREASPLSDGSLEASLLTASRYGVYDFDDALQWDWGRGSILRSIRPKAPKALHAVRFADRVLAGNEYLAEWASSWARDVQVIPTCVDLDDYVPKVSYELQDPPRLGWLGSSLNEGYLRQIGPALLEIHRQSHARLTVMSAGDEPLGQLDSMVDRVPWSIPTFGSEIANWDIGLNPLPDQLWERGKCAYKLLQYGAAGLPAIGSPVGIASTILASAGLPSPNNLDDWTESVLSILALSDSARAALGQRFRGYVATNYSYEAWHSRWLSATLGER